MSEGYDIDVFSGWAEKVCERKKIPSSSRVVEEARRLMEEGVLKKGEAPSKEDCAACFLLGNMLVTTTCLSVQDVSFLCSTDEVSVWTSYHSLLSSLLEKEKRKRIAPRKEGGRSKVSPKKKTPGKKREVESWMRLLGA